ncbi:exported hypothetical protein [Cupriavidus taiwanensis]|uniref:Uncharacterized protein n=1 Tax=Cupriavidus taiwanensis TaxID=164546 RepID=A0A976G177_9BURK|nr:exported hypothetical protein [Cupriavidus taiwanensis]SOZ52643.1 exported hypothetical protein [Cupriavidus taiwanensis]SOZ54874.1 exported hypothetical protein [Cupriavidus taiwanensis]SPA04414.1 exported hypothetical protein [Cupriavidus taiwanensis]
MLHLNMSFSLATIAFSCLPHAAPHRLRRVPRHRAEGTESALPTVAPAPLRDARHASAARSASRSRYRHAGDPAAAIPDRARLCRTGPAVLHAPASHAAAIAVPGERGAGRRGAAGLGRQRRQPA